MSSNITLVSNHKTSKVKLAQKVRKMLQCDLNLVIPRIKNYEVSQDQDPEMSLIYHNSVNFITH